MKLKKLIEKADTLFDSVESDRKKRKKSIKEVLKKLRKRQKELSDRLEGAEETDNQQKLEEKLSLTKIHRKKGLDILKEMKQAKKAEKKAEQGESSSEE